MCSISFPSTAPHMQLLICTIESALFALVWPKPGDKRFASCVQAVDIIFFCGYFNVCIQFPRWKNENMEHEYQLQGERRPHEIRLQKFTMLEGNCVHI